MLTSRRLVVIALMNVLLGAVAAALALLKRPGFDWPADSRGPLDALMDFPRDGGKGPEPPASLPTLED